MLKTNAAFATFLQQQRHKSWHLAVWCFQNVVQGNHRITQLDLGLPFTLFLRHSLFDSFTCSDDVMRCVTARAVWILIARQKRVHGATGSMRSDKCSYGRRWGSWSQWRLSSLQGSGKRRAGVPRVDAASPVFRDGPLLDSIFWGVNFTLRSFDTVVPEWIHSKHFLKIKIHL